LQSHQTTVNIGGTTSKGILDTAQTNKHIMTSYSILKTDVSTVFMVGLSYIVVTARYILLAGAVMWLPHLLEIWPRGFDLSSHFRDLTVKCRKTYYSSYSQSLMPYTVYKHFFPLTGVHIVQLRRLKTLKKKFLKKESHCMCRTMSKSETILKPLNRNYIDTVRYVRNT
jgi:hypothetical protein